MIDILKTSNIDIIPEDLKEKFMKKFGIDLENLVKIIHISNAVTNPEEIEAKKQAEERIIIDNR